METSYLFCFFVWFVSVVNYDIKSTAGTPPGTVTITTKATVCEPAPCLIGGIKGAVGRRKSSNLMVISRKYLSAPSISGWKDSS